MKRFFCMHCDQPIHAEHFWEGLSVTCPGCGKSTELRYRNGQAIPNTGYSISFRNFAQLLNETSYAESIHPLLEELLGCSVKRTANGVQLLYDDGSLIPWEAAHLQIQAAEEAQHRIYNLAMTLWH